MGIHSFLRLFPRLPVDVSGDVKNEFQICFVERNLNEEQRSIIWQRKTFPQFPSDHFKSIVTLSFYKMLAERCNGGDDFIQNEESGIRNCF